MPHIQLAALGNRTLALMEPGLIQQGSFHVLFLIDYLKDTGGLGKEGYGADDEFVNY